MRPYARGGKGPQDFSVLGIQHVDGRRWGDRYPELAAPILQAVSAGGLGMLVTRAPLDHSGSRSWKGMQRFTCLGVYFKEETIIGRGNPESRTVEGNTAPRVGFGIEFSNYATIFEANQSHAVGLLIQNP